MPFTVDQFLDVFSTYNNAVWPMQIVLVLLALVAVVLSFKNRNRSNHIIALILAFFWTWIGVAYHLIYFSSINPAAYAFGALNIVQGGVFFYYGFINNVLTFGFQRHFYAYTGLFFVLYGLLIYPVLGYFLEHVYPQSPTFGLPCPTTIFTFGLLLLTDKNVPIAVLMIPFVWSLIGFTAAFSFGIWEDTGLLVAGLVGTALLVIRNRRVEVGLRHGV